MCKPVWTFILCFFLLFVILFLRIYAPDILLVFSAAQDVVHGLEGGGHGVIHVIVAVLTVTTYAVEVLEGVQILDQVDVYKRQYPCCAGVRCSASDALR